VRRGTTLLNSRSNDLPVSSVLCFRAASMNRSDCSLSSAFSGTLGLRVVGIAHFRISDAFEHVHGALLIVHAQRNPIVMTEVELAQVAMQMAFIAMLIG